MREFTATLNRIAVLGERVQKNLDQAAALMEQIANEDIQLIELLPKLTEREMEVLRLMVRKLDHNQITNQMGISQRTLDAHLYNLRVKLKIQNTRTLQQYVIPWLREKWNKKVK